MVSENKLMQIHSSLKFHYEKREDANIGLKSLNPDNIGPISTKLEDNKLIYQIKENSLKTFLATVDDLLFCEMMVERVLEIEK
jgi:hypothetical protein